MKHNITHKRWSAIIALLFSLITVSQAEESETIFVEPPSPATLARILFGPKYRSAVADKSSGSGRFGMMINFEYDSIKIVPKSLPMLDAVGEALRTEQAANEVLVIEGHADASGPAEYNLNLSERRAQAIKKYLVGTFDVAASTLITIGEGETKPHNREDPYHASNRRVVFRTTRSIVVD